MGAMAGISSERVKQLARELGFELCGVARAEPAPEALFYPEWLRRGFQGAMGYLEGGRAEIRGNPRKLLKAARSIVCVGQVYNTEFPYSTECDDSERGSVSRYAWGLDYHQILKDKLYLLVAAIRSEVGELKYKVCVDTSPLLERAYALRAGLGWIGKNTCLINEGLGSWVFLGEALLSIELEPDGPAPDRCGSCTRCIDACPTDALVPMSGDDGPRYALDSRRCISYWTIEQRGPLDEANRAEVGRNLFGCDICQDVCPWNRTERAALTEDECYQPVHAEPRLEELAALGGAEFGERFRHSPIERARYAGLLRNVCTVMGNSGDGRYVESLRRLAEHEDAGVSEHARWALDRLAKLEC